MEARSFSEHRFSFWCIWLILSHLHFNFFFFSLYQRRRESCSKSLDLSSLKHKENLEMVFAVQGITECQSSLSNPPGLSLWSHLELTESTTGRKTQEKKITDFPSCLTARWTQARPLLHLCRQKVFFYQARKQHGDFKKSFFHCVDAVL